MTNEYQYGGFAKQYPHLHRKDIPYEERMKLYKEGIKMCGCGRSPREDGKCVGFHKLSEQEWNERKEILVEEYKKSQDSSVGRAAD
jgi:hypothetical protein